ncbi:MAG TPA: hypothetical protein PKN81_01075 [Anaerolineales bacterium]|nr:hypothetical protein [Anaerolineales bacterium]
MKKFFSSFFNAPWYPIVISAYPVLALLSSNAGQVQSNTGIRPLLVSVAFGGLLFFIVWVILRRQVHRAAFLTTLLLALFFTYGHAYIAVDEKWPDAGYAQWLAVVWAILLVLAVFWATRPKWTFVSAAANLNTVALALVIMATAQIDFSNGMGKVHRVALEKAPIQEDLTLPENPPDVYFFLLDSYGRSDLLYAAYGFDNSDFENQLVDRGFYIASCSQSNYVRTEISLGSSLNMAYLQGLDETFTPDSTARRVLWDALKHNAVRYNFETLGYETINFASGFAWLEITDVDHFMSPPPASSGMNEFEGLFLRTTLARYAQDLGWVDPDYLMGVSFRDRFNYIFNSMDEIAAMPQPTFAYMHLISPHPPFVFDPEGNPTYPPDFWNDQRMYPADMYQKGYVNQLQYLNKNMLEAVDTILANSDTPPIIIIQSDHGPWLQPKDKRMRNFTAILMPGHEDVLYPTITPVNIFRVVFNAYFGGKYDILEDVSYFSPVPKLYDFSEIKNPCANGN